MKITLRSIVMASVAVAAIAVGTVSAQAESSVKIPFAFKVGNKICPAGEYIIQDGFEHNLVMLKSKDASIGFSWILMPGDDTARFAKVSLRFDAVGDTQFLNSVQYGSLRTPTLDKGSKILERPVTQIIQGQ